jgi:hypothetical protein
MTWARLDDDILMHPKWWALSAQAFQLGIRLIVWANKYSLETGSVSWGVIREMAGGSTRRAKRLIIELVDAGKPIKETGILEPLADGAWKIHDFERYRAPVKAVDSSQVSSARAEAGRAGGQRSAARRQEQYGTAQPSARPEANSRSKPEANSRSKNGFASKQNGAPDPDPGEEFLPAEAAAKDLTGGARVGSPAVAAAAPASPDNSEKVSCPKDLQLSDDHKTQLRAAGVPDYAIVAGVTRFLGKASGDAYGHRTLSAWRNSMYAAVHGMWNDPRQRPNPPESFDKPGPVKAKAAAEIHTYTMPDGRQVRA